MNEAGIEVEFSKSEWGLGQQEINLRYAEALEMADRHALYKNGVKEMAQANAWSATFMAKPSISDIGSSCHIHVSVWDTDDTAKMPDPSAPHELSGLGRSFLGGLLEHTPELMWLFAPNVNSYKRFQSASFAPTAVTWGRDNRTCGYRLVGAAESLRIENRMPGADVNPYLAGAATVMAGLEGIRRQLDPGEPFDGDAYSARPAIGADHAARRARPVRGFLARQRTARCGRARAPSPLRSAGTRGVPARMRHRLGADPLLRAHLRCTVPEYFDLGSHGRPVTTTSADAQKRFDRGSPGRTRSITRRRCAASSARSSRDPGCAMAHWGIAYAIGPNYNKGWDAFDPVDLSTSLERGHAAVRRAIDCLDGATAAEAGLVHAMAARFPSAAPPVAAEEWNEAYAHAMRGVYASHPDDLDVAALFADALMNVTPWQLWDLRSGTPADGAHTAEAQDVLERAVGLPGGRSHPGVLHMYIHLMEMSPAAGTGAAGSRLAAEPGPGRRPPAAHADPHRRAAAATTAAWSRRIRRRSPPTRGSPRGRAR